MVRMVTQIRQESGEWSPVRVVLDAPCWGSWGATLWDSQMGEEAVEGGSTALRPSTGLLSQTERLSGSGSLGFPPASSFVKRKSG